MTQLQIITANFPRDESGRPIRPIPVIPVGPDGNLATGTGGGGGSSGGTATAADPVYTEGTTAQPLSLTLKGRLRVDTVDQGSSNTPAANTITTGGTAQLLFAANPARRGIVLQNQSSGDLYVGNPATQNQSSLKIPAGYYYETPGNFSGTADIQIIGATTGQAFYAREHV